MKDQNPNIGAAPPPPGYLTAPPYVNRTVHIYASATDWPGYQARTAADGEMVVVVPLESAGTLAQAGPTVYVLHNPYKNLNISRGSATVNETYQSVPGAPPPVPPRDVEAIIKHDGLSFDFSPIPTKPESGNLYRKLGLFLLLVMGGSTVAAILSQNKSGSPSAATGDPTSSTPPDGRFAPENCSYAQELSFPNNYQALNSAYPDSGLPLLSAAVCIQLQTVVTAILTSLQLGSNTDCVENFVRGELQAANIVELNNEALSELTQAITDVGQHCSPICFEPFSVINAAFQNVTDTLNLNSANLPLSHNASGTFVHISNQILPLAEALVPNIIAPALIQSAQVSFPCIQSLNDIALVPGLNNPVARLLLLPQTSVCSAQLNNTAADVRQIQLTLLQNATAADLAQVCPATTATALTTGITTLTPSSQGPTFAPSPAPSSQSPTFAPSPAPSSQSPTFAPSPAPSSQAPTSPAPTSLVTQSPSGAPSLTPTAASLLTTLGTTIAPSLAPSTLAPSQVPTHGPTRGPTRGLAPTEADR